MVCGHSEYALPRGRKVDINGYTMDSMRAQTQTVLRGQKPTIKPSESSKPKPKPGKKQLNSTPPTGSTVFLLTMKICSWIRTSGRSPLERSRS